MSKYVYFAEKIGFGDYQVIGVHSSFALAKSRVKNYMNHFGQKDQYEKEPKRNEKGDCWYWENNDDDLWTLAVRRKLVDEKAYWE